MLVLFVDEPNNFTGEIVKPAWEVIVAEMKALNAIEKKSLHLVLIDETTTEFKAGDRWEWYCANETKLGIGRHSDGWFYVSIEIRHGDALIPLHLSGKAASERELASEAEPLFIADYPRLAVNFQTAVVAARYFYDYGLPSPELWWLDEDNAFPRIDQCKGKM